LLKKFKPKSEFTRNVLTLMTGSTIAQAIPIAISPILTRIYTPADYGLVALFMSIATIGSIAATGRYEMAIMLPKKDTDAINVLLLSMSIAFLMSFLSLIIIFLFNQEITTFLGNQDVSSWLYLVPISVILTGIYQSLRYWSNRRKYFTNLAKNSVIQTGTGSSLNLLFGFFRFGGGGLISAGLMSQTVGIIFLGKMAWKKDKILLFKKDKIKMLALMKKYKKLPFFNLPNALIDTFKMSGITILIAKFFTTSILGQYSLAWKMVVTPASLVGNSLSQVFFQKLASANKSDLNRLIVKFIIKASLIALPMYLIVYLFAPEIFIFVFGEKWELAGKIASVLSPWLFLNFISSPLSSVYIIINRQEIMLVISIFYMIVPLSILYVFQDYDFIKTIQVMSLGMSFVLILLIIYIIYLTSKLRKG